MLNFLEGVMFLVFFYAFCASAALSERETADWLRRFLSRSGNVMDSQDGVGTDACHTLQ